MIGFCLKDNKLRFEINLAVAEEARLKTARLPTLAKTVIVGLPKGT